MRGASQRQRAYFPFILATVYTKLPNGGLSTFSYSFFLVSPRTLFLRETAQVEVEHTVDMLVLLLPPAGGDDLQGVTAVSAVVVLQ